MEGCTKMATWTEYTSELKQRKDRIKAMGGPAAVEKQHKQGKLTARERIDRLLDEGSFVEINMFAHHHVTEFGMAKRELPADGVITGFGAVGGRKVYVLAEDFTVMGGTFGEAHGQKICKTIYDAGKAGVPVIMLVDSGGARVTEPIAMMAVYSEVFRAHSIYSGVIPQICGMMGPCAGGQAYSPILTDFLFMTKNSSYMYIAGPALVEAVTSEKVDNITLGGPEMHATVSGCCDSVSEDDETCLNDIKKLLSFLPQNNGEKPPRAETADDPYRSVEGLEAIVPTDQRESYDMHRVIKTIADGGDFFEVKREFAPNIITGFARFKGYSVGIVANNPMNMAGVIDVDAADKYARFIQFCNAFNIPLLNLIDTPAYLVGTQQERKGIIRHGAKILYAYSVATVPKISVLLRKGYAGAYIAMGSKGLGADFVFAWPTAQLCLMGAEGAVSILYRKELEKAADFSALRRQKEEEYRNTFINPYKVASYQHLDLISDIIEPRETRMRIIQALELLTDKREERPYKKTGNIPL